MLLVDALLLVIDSIIVVSSVLIIPLVLLGLYYNQITNEFKLEDD